MLSWENSSLPRETIVISLTSTNFFVTVHRRLSDTEVGWLQGNLFVGAGRVRSKGVHLLTELVTLLTTFCRSGLVS